MNEVSKFKLNGGPEGSETPQNMALRLLKEAFEQAGTPPEEVALSTLVPKEVNQFFLKTAQGNNLKPKDEEGLFWAETATVRHIVDQF